ncbi:aldo/keto reductase [Hoyosella rhizosphaerae]|uniref:Oxidoreductase n=1 Tax=Hoyosella rhizosphaerae TaxID=1755582 RepID=A0A916UHE4_9ACTN|nr:aldo/keto reductase [Hoyosella rhizosphaerae]MBN4928175.1 aldo/keto reductase [Hoyosella rhizosphaerae]GGC73003.1 putative oxidoreductase [Hoyosella rhizosphaerae]
MTVPELQLHDGNSIPQLGFGVWQVDDDAARDAVSTALTTGYRHIDTAKIYENEAGTGQAVRESGIPRDQIFVTTKLWNEDQGRDRALRAFEDSLVRLGLDYIDLYLIHWPKPAENLYVDTFAALRELLADGRVKSLGVSNFQVPHLERLIETTGEVPVLNQIELHPQFSQPELRKFHAKHGILTEAWSPLGQGKVLSHPELVSIAQEVGKSVAQVILRWHLQLGNVVIPKSVTPSRIAENFAIFDFELNDEQVDTITALDVPDGRIGPDPDTF